MWRSKQLTDSVAALLVGLLDVGFFPL